MHLFVKVKKILLNRLLYFGRKVYGHIELRYGVIVFQERLSIVT